MIGFLLLSVASGHTPTSTTTPSTAFQSTRFASVGPTKRTSCHSNQFFALSFKAQIDNNHEGDPDATFSEMTHEYSLSKLLLDLTSTSTRSTEEDALTLQWNSTNPQSTSVGQRHKQRPSSTGNGEDRTKAQIKKLKFLMTQDVEQLIRINDPSAPNKAANNIHRLNTLYQIHGNPDYKPTTLMYNVLIQAYAKSGREDAPEMAEGVLQTMIRTDDDGTFLGAKPNAISYTTVIDAYARSKKKNAAEKAEEILFRMMQLAEERGDDGSRDDSIAPTSITCDAGACVVRLVRGVL